MCLSCHLPIRDVMANQKNVRSSTTRAVGHWAWSRIVGLTAYGAVVVWCAFQMPTSLTFVVPGAVIGAYVQVVKGRSWLGALAFVLIVGLLPLIFVPSLLTDALGRLTDW